MVAGFYCDATAIGFFEGAGDGAVERVPGIGVDIGLERCLQCLAGVVLAEEVGVADVAIGRLGRGEV